MIEGVVIRHNVNGRKFSKPVENTVLKRLVCQTRKNHGLFGKGLKWLHASIFQLTDNNMGMDI